MTVYLVRKFWGAYSDAGEYIVCAFSKREFAVAWVEQQELQAYEENGTLYAAYGYEPPHDLVTLHPANIRDNYWKFPCEYNLETPAYQVIAMEVTA